MKTSVTSAAWAAVITVISGAVIVAGAPRKIALLPYPPCLDTSSHSSSEWDLVSKAFPPQRTSRFTSLRSRCGGQSFALALPGGDAVGIGSQASLKGAFTGSRSGVSLPAVEPR
jgi:hypothetical protein